MNKLGFKIETEIEETSNGLWTYQFTTILIDDKNLIDLLWDYENPFAERKVIRT